jgi:hypothetical protein
MYSKRRRFNIWEIVHLIFGYIAVTGIVLAVPILIAGIICNFISKQFEVIYGACIMGCVLIALLTERKSK